MTLKTKLYHQNPIERRGKQHPRARGGKKIRAGSEFTAKIISQ